MLCGTILGEHHPETLSALNTLAQSSHKVLKFDEARELYEKACSISSRVLGEKHTVTQDSIIISAALIWEKKTPRP